MSPISTDPTKGDQRTIMAELELCKDRKKCFFEATYNGERLFFKAAVLSVGSDSRKMENELNVLQKRIVGVVELRKCLRWGKWALLGLELLKLDLYEAQESLIRGPISIKSAIFRQIVAIVKGLHDQAIFHKDLSPKNIMLTGPEYSQVKLIDFETSGPKDQANSRTTRPFAAPEFYRKGWGIPFEGKSEVWNLGIIYLFLTQKSFKDYLVNDYQKILSANFDENGTMELINKIQSILYSRSAAVEEVVLHWLDPCIESRATLNEVLQDTWRLGYELFTPVDRAAQQPKKSPAAAVPSGQKTSKLFACLRPPA